MTGGDEQGRRTTRRTSASTASSRLVRAEGRLPAGVQGPSASRRPASPESRPAEAAQQRVEVEGLWIHYLIRVTILKIGRYSATTRPPMITPRMTIMTGSSSDMSALTAPSTSSS